MPGPGPEELLTAKEVSRLFKVHWKTLCRWADQGKFPKPAKMEGQLRWVAREVWECQFKVLQGREGQKFSDEPMGRKGTEGDSKDIRPKGR